MSERGMRAVTERAPADPVVAEVGQELYAAGSLVQREVLERARAAGELPADPDVDLAVARPAGPLVHLRPPAGAGFDTGTVRAVVDGFPAS